MTQANERSATLSQMVAEEIRALMARRRMSGRQLATELKVSPSWVSYRLTGAQPIDVNDLMQIARALGVGVHELLPPPDKAAQAADPGVTARYLPLAVQSSTDLHRLPDRPRDNRPAGRCAASTGTRTAYLDRVHRRKRDR